MKIIHKYDLEELEQIIREYYQGMGYDNLTIDIEKDGATVVFDMTMNEVFG